MIAQRNMAEGASKTNMFIFGGAEAKLSQKDGGFPVFQDILARTQSAAQAKQPAKPQVKARADTGAAVTADELPGKVKTQAFKSFREAASSTAVKGKPEKASGSAAAKNAAAEDDPVKAADAAKASQKKADAVQEALAGLLGISRSELTEILKQANIRADSLPDKSQAEGNASKLASLMGLDGDEKKILETILSIAAEKLSAGAEAVQIQKTAAIGQAAAITGAEAADPHIAGTADKTGTAGDAVGESRNVQEMEAVQVKAGSFAEVLAKLKAQLEALAKNYGIDPEKVKAQISGRIESAVQATAGLPAEAETQALFPEPDSTAEDLKNAQSSGVMPVEAKTEAAQNKGGAAGENGNGRERDGKDGGQGGLGPVKTGLEAQKSDMPDKAGNEGPMLSKYAVNPANTFSESLKEVKEAQTLLKAESAQRSEILNQVIEKAKVVLNKDKSEMVMDLEPDNLGKLTLKVITEHGIVTAKFMAESQQVKQVLEANMQTLKDSLEKQGLNFQGFSVSVGYGDTGGRSEGSGAGREGVAYLRSGQVREIGGRTATDGARPSGYRWGEESRINLTA